MQFRRINLIMVLLALGGIYSIAISVLTILEYLPTPYTGVVSSGSLFHIGLGIFAFLLVYGLGKRRSWALLASIIFMAFGVVASIEAVVVNIVQMRMFELTSTIGIAGIILFPLGIYYLTRQQVRREFK